MQAVYCPHRELTSPGAYPLSPHSRFPHIQSPLVVYPREGGCSFSNFAPAGRFRFNDKVVPVIEIRHKIAVFVAVPLGQFQKHLVKVRLKEETRTPLHLTQESLTGNKVGNVQSQSIEERPSGPGVRDVYYPLETPQ